MDDAKRRSVEFTGAFAGKDNWDVLEFRNKGRDLELEKRRGYDSLRELVRQPGLFHLVAMATRPGVYLYCRRLELIYFPWGTPRNEDFGYRVVRWEDMPWVVMTIPAKCRRFAERVAEKLRLRIADGVPTVFSSPTEPPAVFPMRGPTVWTLEYGRHFPPPDFDPGRENEMVEDLERAHKATRRN